MISPRCKLGPNARYTATGLPFVTGLRPLAIHSLGLQTCNLSFFRRDAQRLLSRPAGRAVANLTRWLLYWQT